MGDTQMGGTLIYLVLLGGAFATAMALYFGLKAVKLI
ncbi:MAG: cytochrome b6-f complex subunit PetL [Cyanobacteria bacterium J06635_15]